MAANTLWRCPSCERAFPKRGQQHSCASYSVDDHFAGKPPALRELFDHLVARLEASGPVKIDAVKSAVNLASNAHFAMAYVQKDSIKLEFVQDRQLHDPRIFRVQKLSPRKYTHGVKLARPEDVDEQLAGWLRRAYALSR